MSNSVVNSEIRSKIRSTEEVASFPVNDQRNLDEDEEEIEKSTATGSSCEETVRFDVDRAEEAQEGFTPVTTKRQKKAKIPEVEIDGAEKQGRTEAISAITSEMLREGHILAFGVVVSAIPIQMSTKTFRLDMDSLRKTGTCPLEEKDLEEARARMLHCNMTTSSVVLKLDKEKIIQHHVQPQYGRSRYPAREENRSIGIKIRTRYVLTYVTEAQFNQLRTEKMEIQAVLRGPAGHIGELSARTTDAVHWVNSLVSKQTILVATKALFRIESGKRSLWHNQSVVLVVGSAAETASVRKELQLSNQRQSFMAVAQGTMLQALVSMKTLAENLMPPKQLVAWNNWTVICGIKDSPEVTLKNFVKLNKVERAQNLGICFPVAVGGGQNLWIGQANRSVTHPSGRPDMAKALNASMVNSGRLGTSGEIEWRKRTAILIQFKLQGIRQDTKGILQDILSSEAACLAPSKTGAWVQTVRGSLKGSREVDNGVRGEENAAENLGEQKYQDILAQLADMHRASTQQLEATNRNEDELKQLRQEISRLADINTELLEKVAGLYKEKESAYVTSDMVSKQIARTEREVVNTARQRGAVAPGQQIMDDLQKVDSGRALSAESNLTPGSIYCSDSEESSRGERSCRRILSRSRAQTIDSPEKISREMTTRSVQKALSQETTRSLQDSDEIIQLPSIRISPELRLEFEPIKLSALHRGELSREGYRKFLLQQADVKMVRNRLTLAQKSEDTQAFQLSTRDGACIVRTCLQLTLPLKTPKETWSDSNVIKYFDGIMKDPLAEHGSVEQGKRGRAALAEMKLQFRKRQAINLDTKFYLDVDWLRYLAPPTVSTVVWDMNSAEPSLLMVSNSTSLAVFTLADIIKAAKSEPCRSVHYRSDHAYLTSASPLPKADLLEEALTKATLSLEQKVLKG